MNTKNTTSVSFALLTSFMMLFLPTTAAAGSTGSDSTIVSWTWTPASLDAFADGAVGDSCEKTAYMLTQEDLRKLFPALGPEPTTTGGGKVGEGVVDGAVTCEGSCTCGACIVVNGQVACTACFACCGAGKDCQSDCSSNLKDLEVTSSCDCVEPPGPSNNTTRIIDELTYAKFPPLT